MAADPIPMPANDTEVTINADGSVDGEVEVNNGGVIKFQVTGYPTDPSTGEPYNVCIVSVTTTNISWATEAIAGQNTIKVGNGG